MKQKKIEHIIIVVLLIASIIVSIKMIFCGYYIDESYHVNLSHRIAQGETIFGEVRDVYATSAFLCAGLEKIYIDITAGVSGLVVFLRLSGVLLQLFVSIVLYKTINKQLNSFHAVLIGFSFFSMYPKLTAIPEYTNGRQWFTVLMICSLYWAWDSMWVRKRYIVISAVCYCISILFYPSQIVLVPVLVIGMAVLSKEANRNVQTLFWFTCAVMGIIFLLYLQITTGIKEVIRNIVFIVQGDGTHFTKTNIIGENVWISKAQGIKVIIQYIIIIVIVTFLIFAFFYVTRLIRKKGTSKKLTLLYIGIIVSYIPSIFLWVQGGSYDVIKLYHIVVIFITVGLMKMSNSMKDEEIEFCYFAISIGVVLWLSTELVTNLPLEMNVIYLQVGMIFSLFSISLMYKHEPQKITVLLFFVCIMSFFSTSFLMRDSPYGANILSMRKQMVLGPCKGLYVNENEAFIFEKEFSAVAENVSENESVLIIANSLNVPTSTLYLTKHMIVSNYATSSTSIYPEILLLYWSRYPDKYPEVIAVDKSYGTSWNFNEKTWIYDFVKENYSLMEATEYMDFYRME